MPKRTSMRATLKKPGRRGAGKRSGKPQERLVLDRSSISQLMSEMGRRGGLRGGKARAASLTKEERTAIAKRAAQKRWSRPVREQTGFEEQKRAFQSIPPQVLAPYTGNFVISRNGRIIDSDEKLSRLTGRFFARHRGGAVYITRVGIPVRIPTPLVKE